MKVGFIGLGNVGGKLAGSLLRNNFDLSPRGIREMLGLNKPIYECTAAYGHFGRKDKDFLWEEVKDLSEYMKKWLENYVYS